MATAESTGQKKTQFLLEAYKLRAQLHSEHTSRLWTRFNFLLTAEIALLGLLYAGLEETPSLFHLRVLAVIGIGVSLLWYILGAQDRYYFEGLRQQVRGLEENLARELKVSTLKEFPFGEVQNVSKGPLTWRLRFISLSRLVALIPIVFLVLWIGLYSLMPVLIAQP